MPQDTGFNRRHFLKGAGMTALAGAAASASGVAIADDDDGQGLFRTDHYDFDTVYHRAGFNCARWDSPAKRYPGGEFKYGMGVATMDFECAPCITEALAERCQHRTWGYMASTDSLKEAIAEFNVERNNLELDPSMIELPAIPWVPESEMATFRMVASSVETSPPESSPANSHRLGIPRSRIVTSGS